MRRATSSFVNDSLSHVQRVSIPVRHFSAFGKGRKDISPESFRQKIDMNVLLFCPREEGNLRRFAEEGISGLPEQGEYPKFIKDMMPESVSVTDVAHFPANNERAILGLLTSRIAPSMIIPHLVLIGHSKEDADSKIRFFHEKGVETIFVVRGNPVVLGKSRDYKAHPEGYEDMPHLMRRVKEISPKMQVLVTGYPVKHPYAKSVAEDFDELKKKVDSGADGIVTQHFFDMEHLLGFVEGCEQRGIRLPMMPSIMPIGNPKYLFNFSKSADVPVPAEVSQLLFSQSGMTTESTSISDPEVEKRAVNYTARLIQRLVDLKLPQVDRINTYAANNIPFLTRVFKELGFRSQVEEQSRG